MKLSRLMTSRSGGANARHHPPRTQRIKHPSLADEGRAIRGRVHAVVRWRPSLEQLLEFFNTQTGITHDAAHRKRIHRIMARDREDADSIRHYDVFALPDDAEACPLQRPHRFKVIDTGNLGHG